MRASGIFLLVLLSGCQRSGVSPSAKPADLQGDWAKMRPITPRGYVCGRATTPITIDGNADEPAWAAAPWTADFVDIEDAAHAKPRFRTRAKMLWDDENLYIYAQLQEPHVWGTLTHKNDIIFQDNDFEIFIDPNGDNHNYYEYEMNALNTIWELTLPKPYRDDGQPQLGTNIPGLRSAVHVDGTLNDPHDTDRGWSVEIAIPWKGLARYADGISCPPKDGQQWRMDFSRVEWLVDIIDGKYHKIPKESRAEDNWVWSPTGIIDMHRPERWGFVQFSTAGPGAAGFHPDPTLPARDALMDVYYRQRAFKQRFGRYASSLRDLHMSGDGSAGLEPPIEMKRQGADTKDIDRAIEQGLVSPIEVKPSAAGYIATAKVKSANGATRVLHVRQDSKLWEE